MSDFKRKIEIVESTTPPTNRYNWWFDLNEKELKRWTGSEWELYNYTWPKMPYSVANNEILIVGEALEDNGLDLNNLENTFSEWGTIKEIRKETDDLTYIDYCYIVFNEDLTTITTEYTLDVFQNLWTSIDVYFPKSLTSIKTVDTTLLNYTDASVNLHFSNLKYFSGSIGSADNWNGSLYIYSKTIPQIDSIFIDGWEMGYYNQDIYVPSVLVNKYKKSTNWSQYTIEAID